MTLGRFPLRLVLFNALLLSLALLLADAWERGSQGPSLRWLGVSLAIVVVNSAVLAVGLARWWDRPMRRIAEMVENLSEGDLSTRAEVAGSGELAELARALNELRRRWSDDLLTIDRQRQALAALLDQLHEGVVVARPDGRISLINPAAVRLLGLEAGQRSIAAFIGQTVEQFVPQHELQKMLHVPAGEPRPRSLSADALFEREARIQVGRAGGAVHLLARVSDVEMFDVTARTSGPTVGRLLVLTDITELARTLQVKTDFVANASHELRTPLSTIRAAVETVQHMNLAEEGDDARHFLGVIERQVVRLTAMVSDLLDLARLESGDARFRVERLSLPEALREVESRFLDVVAAKGLKWSCAAECDEAATLMVSPQLLRLVLDNLVDNAIKFTERGGRVALRAGRRRAEAYFEVSDSGCGIPDHEQERVFERFYQVERARSGPQRGTGLGLSIVRHAVATMNGAVTLQSRMGEGTTVSVRIPQPD